MVVNRNYLSFFKCIMNNYESENCLNIVTSETGPNKPLVAGSNPAVATWFSFAELPI
jgi:hypothetical protein